MQSHAQASIAAETLATGRPTSDYARGALFGLAAVSIWAGNIVVGGLGLRSSLTPWDITAIRFAVAGVVLLPLLMRRGWALERLGWLGVAALVIVLSVMGGFEASLRQRILSLTPQVEIQSYNDGMSDYAAIEARATRARARRIIGEVVQGEREAGMERDDGSDLPSAHNRVGHAVHVMSKTLAVAHRQLINRVAA